VAQAFLDALGPDGTLMVPTFTHCFAPRDGVERARQGPFDRDKTPSSVGRITETVRLWPGACRSIHPIHSAAAVGRLAVDLTTGHALASDFGAETPFGRSIHHNALIILLGVSQKVHSTLHAIEDLVDMPYLTDEQALMMGRDGQVEVFRCLKCPVGCRDFYRGDDSKWNRAIQQTGVVRQERIGQAQAQVMRSASLTQAAVELLRREPDLLLCDKPDCAFCRWARGQIETHGIRDPLSEA
jgi:aminoglycoside 3-N-acetyltransferase